MSASSVLILHTVVTVFGRDAAEELRAGIEERLPDVDVEVARTPPASRESIDSAEIVVAGWLPGDILDDAPVLRWVQSTFAGIDSYPVERLREAEVALSTASGVHAEPIAEQVIGYLLAFERGLDRAFRQQSRGVWERYSGGELKGGTLGIVGVGAIGTRVAELGSAFDMHVIGTKRDPGTAPDAVDEIMGPDGLYDLLDAADYVVVACPLTGETEGLIGGEELAAMKRSAVLVNVARGEIVDEPALVRTLQGGGIRGAALDAFEREPLPAESPLWDLSNAIVTPHMAGTTPRYMERLADIFARNYRRLGGGREPENEVVPAPTSL